jgi:hypothetical protein
MILLPVEGDDKGDGRHASRLDEHHGGHDAFRADGLAVLLAGASTGSAATWDVRDGRPSLMQPPQQTDVAAATAVNKEQPTKDTTTLDRPTARALDFRVLDQSLAGLDDSMFVGSVQGDEVLV